MKKHPFLKGLAVSLALLSTLGITVFAASYDSSMDPIVSLSYLTDIFRPSIEEDYNEKIDGLLEKIAELEDRIDRLAASGYSPDTESETETEPETEPEPVMPEIDLTQFGYEVLELTLGQSLYANGACDIMLRAGQAVCVAPDAAQGLSDYTDGAEIYDGQALTKNHMCLIPRGDGRGIRAASESVFIMIRGEYTIVTE